MDICGETYVLISIRDEVLFGDEDDVIFAWRTASGWALRECLMRESPS